MSNIQPKDVPAFYKKFIETIYPEPNTGCWLWAGSLHRVGCGWLSVGQQRIFAHRFAYEYYNNVKLTAKAWICHSCSVPSCCNPQHMYISCKSLFHKVHYTKNPIYGAWADMKNRCYNKNSINYHNYGGRGIGISDEFRRDFKAWLDYVSSLPQYENRIDENLTIDRVDNDKGYQRGNLRWATKKEQANNTRITNSLKVA